MIKCSKFSVYLILLTLVVPLSTQPAHAIFGLSKCEKVIKTLNLEQKIGAQSWLDFDDVRDSYAKKQNLTYGEWIYVMDYLVYVLNSDSKIYEQIDRNPKCFDAKFLAKNRQYISGIKEEIKSIANSKKWVTANFMQNSLAYEANVQFLRTTYQQFLDWKTRKVLYK